MSANLPVDASNETFANPANALQHAPPWPVARMISLALCAMAVAALAYACLASVDIVVTAQGRVIPPGRSKVVQPLEAGVVKAIAVRDGQSVRAGDLLVELDSTATHADRDRLRRELWESEADVLRLSRMLAGSAVMPPAKDVPEDIMANQQAILAGRMAEQRSRLAAMDADIARRKADGDAVAAGIAQLGHSLPLMKKKNGMREELAQTGHVAETSLIETRLELMAMEKEIAVQGNRLKEARAGFAAAVQQRAQAEAEFRARASAERVDAGKKRDAARQELIKTSQRIELQRLRSPIDGVVQQLAVSTVGGIVTPAQALLTVVPADSALEVEAQVLNRDIGHVKVDQRVINKIETFDFTRYGYIEGTVLWVGTDAITDQKLGPVYPVRIRLASPHTPGAVAGRPGAVSAGMNVTVDIRTGDRRLIQYFLAPLLRYRQEALRER
ncbi:MAG: HlyD family type I secretion periplasmic adaptor subunit [Variovorax sp.]